MTSIYKMDICRVIDAATDAVVQKYQAAITDERETLSRSTWLTSIVLGVTAAAIAIHSNNTSVLVEIFRLTAIVFSIVSFSLAVVISTKANFLINQYQILITAAFTQKTNVFGEDIPEAIDPQVMANKIYEFELCKANCHEQARKANEAIKNVSKTSTVMLTNRQLWVTTSAIVAILLQYFSGTCLGKAIFSVM